MSVSVVVAWKDLGDAHRLRALDHVLDHWHATLPDAEVVVSTPEPFTRARGINAGVKQTSGTVIVQSDPDSLVAAPQIVEAIRLAEAADGLVLPFTGYRYLNEVSTMISLAEPVWMPYLRCDEEGDGGVGNVTVFSRRTWELVGGLDERFGMWGGDDGAFAYATSTLVAPLRRVDGSVFHLWHPRLPESVPDHPAYIEQFALVGQYRDAEGDVEQMTAILDGRTG